MLNQPTSSPIINTMFGGLAGASLGMTAHKSAVAATNAYWNPARSFFSVMILSLVASIELAGGADGPPALFRSGFLVQSFARVLGTHFANLLQYLLEVVA